MRSSPLGALLSLVLVTGAFRMAHGAERPTSHDGAYIHGAFGNLFNATCNVHGAVVTAGDTPNGIHEHLLHANSASSALKGGSATINFQVATTERVKIQVFDVSGRLVRTLANRTLKAGEHRFTWNGVDNAGGRSPRGVYFVRSMHSGSAPTGPSKLIVLKPPTSAPQ